MSTNWGNKLVKCHVKKVLTLIDWKITVQSINSSASSHLLISKYVAGHKLHCIYRSKYWINKKVGVTVHSGNKGGRGLLNCCYVHYRPTFSLLKDKSSLLNHVIYLRNWDKLSVYWMMKLTKTTILPSCHVPIFW